MKLAPPKAELTFRLSSDCTSSLFRAARAWTAVTLIAVISPPGAGAQQTVGGGSIETPAQGPVASYNLGQGAILVKNWDFGTDGTVKNMADMDTHFKYQDQFGKYNNGGDNYGAGTVASSSATRVAGQKVEGVDTFGKPVREFVLGSLKTYLVPLTSEPQANPYLHNVGCGSFVAKWKMPKGGSRLGMDIIWETRVRCVTPRGFWFAIWTAGNIWRQPPDGTKWPAGAEMDVVESFGYTNDNGATNYDGRYWHSGSVGGYDYTDYKGWSTGMASRGITSYDAAQYHTWTWVYRADDTYSVYNDGREVQSGTIHWTYGATLDGPPIDMTFLFDGSWGHTEVSSMDDPIPMAELNGKYYEWDYSRVYLRPAGLRYDAELIENAVSSDPVSLHADTLASGGLLERLDANMTNDYVTYTLPSVPAGTYNVKVCSKTRNTRGKVQLSIDGTNLGNEQDYYSTQLASAFVRRDLGPKTFSSSGLKNLTFKVTGKNPYSSGYEFVLDYLDLIGSGLNPCGITMDTESGSGVTVIGDWGFSDSVNGFLGSGYLTDGNELKGEKSVRFQPTLPSNGSYAVWFRWTSGTNRATNVPVDIVRADGSITTLSVNQQANNGTWYSLGVHSLSAANASVTVRTGGTTGAHVIVDAVRFVPASMAEVTMDSENTAGVTKTGEWLASTSRPGYLGANYLHDGNTGKGKSIKFTPSLGAAGYYQVKLRWTAEASRATNIPVEIVLANGSKKTVIIGQENVNWTWFPLGIFYLSPSNASVTIKTAHDDGTPTNEYVIVDAIQFTPF